MRWCSLFFSFRKVMYVFNENKWMSRVCVLLPVSVEVKMEWLSSFGWLWSFARFSMCSSLVCFCTHITFSSFHLLLILLCSFLRRKQTVLFYSASNKADWPFKTSPLRPKFLLFVVSSSQHLVHVVCLNQHDITILHLWFSLLFFPVVSGWSF